MIDIHSALSDSDLEEEFVAAIKRRSLDQKFVYLGTGAANYYKAFVTQLETNSTIEWSIAYMDFIIPHIQKDKKIALISLWCGNAYVDKDLLKKLISDGYQIDYFWVDSSKEMIDLAKKNMEDLSDLNQKYICADILTQSFKDEINRFTKWYDKRLFAFFGWSFGNLNQTSITDGLYNILEKNDLLRFNVITRKSNDENIKMKLFDRYTKYTIEDRYTKFRLTPIRKAGIPIENGKVTLRTSQETSIWAIVFTISFICTKKTVIKINNHTIHILPGEEIDICAIRNYDLETFSNFMEEHDFVTQAKETGKFNERLFETHFLFEKK